MREVKLDLHVHSVCSKDSIISFSSLHSLSKKGWVFALTDHNTVCGWEKLYKKGVKFIPGEEISTLDGDVIGLYLTEAIPSGFSALEAIDLIHSQGGLALLPHIFDPTRHGVKDKEAWKRADIIEGWNARAPSESNKKALSLAKSLGKVISVGSDAHLPWELGRSYVSVKEIPESPKHLLHLLNEGEFNFEPAPFSVRLFRAVKFKIKSLLRHRWV